MSGSGGKGKAAVTALTADVMFKHGHAAYRLRPLASPMFDAKSGAVCRHLDVIPGRFYTIGRSKSTCDLIFQDKRVSRQHCQIYLDPKDSLLYLLDGSSTSFCKARQTASENEAYENEEAGNDATRKPEAILDGSTALTPLLESFRRDLCNDMANAELDRTPSQAKDIFEQTSASQRGNNSASTAEGISEDAHCNGLSAIVRASNDKYVKEALISNFLQPGKRSLNGIYVNGRRLGVGTSQVLNQGSEVSLVESAKGSRSLNPRFGDPVGFIVVKLTATAKSVYSCCKYETNSGNLLASGHLQGNKRKVTSPTSSYAHLQKRVAGSPSRIRSAAANFDATKDGTNTLVCHWLTGNSSSSFSKSGNCHEECLDEAMCRFSKKHRNSHLEGNISISNTKNCGEKRKVLDNGGSYIWSKEEDPGYRKGIFLGNKFHSMRSREKPSLLIKSAEKLIEASQSLRNSVSTAWDNEASKGSTMSGISQNGINEREKLHEENSLTMLRSRCKNMARSQVGELDILERAETARPCQRLPELQKYLTAQEVRTLKPTSVAESLIPSKKCEGSSVKLSTSDFKHGCLDQDEIIQLTGSSSCQMLPRLIPEVTSNFITECGGDGLDIVSLAICHPSNLIQPTADVHLTSNSKLVKYTPCSGLSNTNLEALRFTEGDMESVQAGKRRVSTRASENILKRFDDIYDRQSLGSGSHSNSSSEVRALVLEEQQEVKLCCPDLRVSESLKVDILESHYIPLKSAKSTGLSSPCLAANQCFSNPLPHTGLEKQSQYLALDRSTDCVIEKIDSSCIPTPSLTVQFPLEKFRLNVLVHSAEEKCLANEYVVKYCKNISRQEKKQNVLTSCSEGIKIKFNKCEASKKCTIGQYLLAKGACVESEKKTTTEVGGVVSAPLISNPLTNVVLHSENSKGAEYLVNGKPSKILPGSTYGVPDRHIEDCPVSIPMNQKERAPFIPKKMEEAKDSLMIHAATSEVSDCLFRDNEGLNPCSNICSAKYGPGSHGFCLNKLEWMDHSSSLCSSVALQELLTPLDDVQAIFVATFTCDIQWFMHSNNISPDLPVTVCCHDSERCWSPSITNRSSVPYSEWPNLRIVYPSFPDVCSFKGEHKRRGIGCHHPKFFLLKRRGNLRVIISSANLNARQWLHVSNTVWWQDFYRQDIPNFQALFEFSKGQMKDPKHHNVAGDFAAQLASFVASLLMDIPEEARWVVDLAFYDFSKASASLVTSIPGLHRQRIPYFSNDAPTVDFFSKQTSSTYLGIVDSTVVGIIHRFRPEADPNGVRLRALATISSKGSVDADGLIQVILKREMNVSVDPNAVSVLVPLLVGCSQEPRLERGSYSHEKSSLSSSQETYVHLGFLPKTTAKWVATLCDSGFCSFKAKLSLREAFLAASSQSKRNVQLMLYVFHGPEFLHLSESMLSVEIVAALSSLLGSLHHSVGVWRLQEILSYYNWRDSEETEFIYGSSSMGISLDAPFFAYFSAAVGRRAFPSLGSNESDPEWGCWTAAHEVENPSIGLVFPTIERAKRGRGGLDSHYGLLSFAESTWKRLKEAQLLHDAVPYPAEREGVAMHVKVARRRFQHSSGIAYGWVYCGSHNFSPAAWGKFISKYSPRDADTGITNDNSLHICNYELGLVFVEPPPELKAADAIPCHSGSMWHQTSTSDMIETGGTKKDLDRYILPFVVPPPRYQHIDHPATGKALYEARCDLRFKLLPKVISEDTKLGEILTDVSEVEAPVDGDLEPEQQLPLLEHHIPSNGDENYAEALFIQLDSFDSF
ncbi:hypothetical protein O6H91_08G051000 [Diphasiastrum complanatum]|uniref:Uncharacterized protein n=2 Tax=Diphasiastrum complanatum TaxID=34168 RepID=A0ACC2CXH6_DIPCM|nr:hypothetical protein O6H91_08G051000 [Diphasiastrum complanatum]KAJ7546705.1 hypothetical protein O6H91_08G051000 [Diphasiastrum complanatum]